MGRSVLVTGGAGYIGSHTCKALSARGFEPICYDNLVRGRRQAVKWGPFEEGDIRDFGRLISVLHKYQPEAVIHFAAYAYIGESMIHPMKYYENNVVGSLTLLNAMHSQGVRKIVFSSTCATYGVPKVMPISENNYQNPVNPYGCTKLIIENMLQDFAAAYDFACCALRYFNAAGADPEGELGEQHDPETHLIPNVLLTAVGRKDTVSVFGDDYDTPDGTCIRDYIHVTDLAEAHVLALEALDNGAKYQFYNLGNEVGSSVKEVIEMSNYVCGRDIPFLVVPRRKGDPPTLIADSSKARRELCWTPQYNDLEQIISTAWKWFSRTN